MCIFKHKTSCETEQILSITFMGIGTMYEFPRHDELKQQLLYNFPYKKIAIFFFILCNQFWIRISNILVKTWAVCLYDSENFNNCFMLPYIYVCMTRYFSIVLILQFEMLCCKMADKLHEPIPSAYLWLRH